MTNRRKGKITGLYHRLVQKHVAHESRRTPDRRKAEQRIGSLHTHHAHKTHPGYIDKVIEERRMQDRRV